jgi:hypothetical protein
MVILLGLASVQEVTLLAKYLLNIIFCVFCFFLV